MTPINIINFCVIGFSYIIFRDIVYVVGVFDLFMEEPCRVYLEDTLKVLASIQKAPRKR